ncbi:MAG: hypothetical protein FWH26_01380 [Oscillospiraceae bacterium]|nr:hypothetical protein [Oscillospiraceae bacterium]
MKPLMKKGWILLLALALTLALAACGGGEPTQLTESSTAESTESMPWWETGETQPRTETETETESETDEPTENNQAANATNATNATTTKAPAGSGAQTQTKTPTTKAPTTKAPTTKAPTTAKPTTNNQVFANPISINNKDQAFAAFNDSVRTVISKKPAMIKSHAVTWDNWLYTEETLEGLNLGGIGSLLGDPSKYLAKLTSDALLNGTRTSSAQKGDSNTQMIKACTWTMSDMKDVVYSRDGSDWIITLTVKDGSTRQQQKLLSAPVSGSSPIDKGPLNYASNNIYDHNSADKVFALLNNNLVLGSIFKPIDISEETRQTKFVARLDGEGKLTNLVCTYHQTILLTEIQVPLANKTYRDNMGSGSVRIHYTDFSY